MRVLFKNKNDIMYSYCNMTKKKTINVVVIGTNDFDDYAFFEEKLYKKLERYFEEDYKIIIREQEVNATDGFAVKFSK